MPSITPKKLHELYRARDEASLADLLAGIGVDIYYKRDPRFKVNVRCRKRGCSNVRSVWPQQKDTVRFCEACVLEHKRECGAARARRFRARKAHQKRR